MFNYIIIRTFDKIKIMRAKEFLERNEIPDRQIFGRKPKGQMPEYSGSLSELMEEYSNQSKWISVKERLPVINSLNDWGSSSVKVLGLFSDLHIEDCYLNSCEDNTEYWCYAQDGDLCNPPTHWQPLPEAP